MPGRPDIHKVVDEIGHKQGRIGAQNAWPVDLLQPGDVYVCDHFGLKIDGPSIEGLKKLPNFTSFVRSYHPSHHYGSLGPKLNSTMMGINCPIRIGRVMVMPGDVVLGRDGGVIFIPPHLAERVVRTSEVKLTRGGRTRLNGISPSG